MKTLSGLVGFSLVLFSLAGPLAQAELATLVADLAVGNGPTPSSTPWWFSRLGNRVVFSAFETPGGWTVWGTDGSPDGTRRLSPMGSFNEPVGILGNHFLWWGGSGNDPSLWRTAGTPASTRLLVPNGVSSYDEGSAPWAIVGPWLYFFRDGWQLWASDGATRTFRVSSRPARIVDEAVGWRGRLFFTTAERMPGPGHAPLHLFQLWTSDGTEGGTRALLVPTQDTRISGLQFASRGVVFVAGDRVWVSDGTVAGTVSILGAPASEIDDFRWLSSTAAGWVTFFAKDRRRGWELWSSDGHSARWLARGLAPVGDAATALGGRLYFPARDENGDVELWSTGGTARSTARVLDLCPGPCPGLWGHASLARPLVAAGERLFFFADDGVHGPELWTSDGSAGGTRLVRDLEPGSGGSWAELSVVDGEVFFYGQEPIHGVELWASDGTAAGTRRLSRDYPDGPVPLGPPLPPSVAVLADTVVTSSFDPRAGWEPWALDLHGGGGVLLRDIGGGGEPGLLPSGGVALGDRLLFKNLTRVWATEGSPENTQELGRAPSGFQNEVEISRVGEMGYLKLIDLWRTDGTAAGTTRLATFDTPGGARFISTPVVEHAGQALFGVASTPFAGTTLWASDGSIAGTRELAVSFPSLLRSLTSVEGRAYFWAISELGHAEVWTLDATLSSPKQLSNAQGEWDQIGWPQLTRWGSGACFFADQIWCTDGQNQGGISFSLPPVEGEIEPPVRLIHLPGSPLVVASFLGRDWHCMLFRHGDLAAQVDLVKDFGPNTKCSSVANHENELWLHITRPQDPGGSYLVKSDGTTEGTRVGLDLTALGVDVHAELFAAPGRVFFAGYSSAGDHELWVSEGTKETTRRLQEIHPGAPGSAPATLGVAGSRLYFSADDGLHGRELWSLPLEDLGPICRPSTTALCLGRGRFRVELFRHNRTGSRGEGRAIPWSSSSGAFWFYNHGNPEVAVKLVDGGPVNSNSWLFFGGLTDAYLALTVTDLLSGEVRRYPEQPGPLAPFADLAAFPSLTEAANEPEPSGATRAPVQLHGGRFEVSVEWVDRGGIRHSATGFPHGDRAAYFTFGNRENVELVVKLLDGRPVNGRFWLFATTLTHLETTLTVRDTQTGEVKTYTQPFGRQSSIVDLL